MRIRNRLWVLRSVLLVLAMSGSEAAAADNGAVGMGDGAGVDQSATSSESAPSRHPWFDPDALDLNVYGLAYHPDRDTVHRLNLDNEFNPGLGLH